MIKFRSQSDFFISIIVLLSLLQFHLRSITKYIEMEPTLIVPLFQQLLRMKLSIQSPSLRPNIVKESMVLMSGSLKHLLTSSQLLSPIDHKVYRNGTYFNSSFISATSPNEIINIVSQLKTKYSEGIDGINVRVIKASTNLLAAPLSNICIISPFPLAVSRTN